MPTRTGTCNMCAECCGNLTQARIDASIPAPGPFPKIWPESVRTHPIENLPTFFQLVGTPEHGEARARAIRIGNTTFRTIWIPGVGLVRDKAPWGDTSTYEEECPFLLGSPGDTTRACGLVGTPWEAVRDEMCGDDHVPPLSKEDFEVVEWEHDHPSCSYVYVE
jgi:hypothetical protein